MLDDRITQSRATTPSGRRNLPGPLPVEDIPDESLARNHEVRDAELRPILIFGLVLLLSAIVIHVGLWLFLRLSTPDPLPLRTQILPAEVTPPPSAGPGIEAFPWDQLDRLVSDQVDRLNSYGWVDREQGVVHIPIERAMQLVAERGLAVREGAQEPSFGLAPAYELESSGGQAAIPANSSGSNRDPGEIHAQIRKITVSEAAITTQELDEHD